jgi:hypothetical protein
MVALAGRHLLGAGLVVGMAGDLPAWLIHRLT